MDVFDLRARLVADYESYTRSFIKIRDPHINEFVDDQLGMGTFWPEPLLQLNPTFLAGGTVDDLVGNGVLHPECARIFRIDKSDSDYSGKQLLLHEHQREAIIKAKAGKSYVLTSGTGSGKSLTYIVPIVDHVLRNGSGRGIQAIVVYPMNALANSQDEELKKFLEKGYPEGQSPVRFAGYTGQEEGPLREAIRSNPPDILLTNYMMLELLLTRAEDRELVRAAHGLRFLVFDELHTYRGRQGADVALLIRRCRQAFGAHDMVCIGTSATMANGGSTEDQRREVARVARSLFGVNFEPEQVVGETDHCRVGHGCMPAFHRQLARHDGRADPATVVNHLQELAEVVCRQWIGPPFIQDEQLGLGESPQEPRVGAVSPGQVQITKELRYSVAAAGVAEPASRVSQGVSDVGLAYPGRAGERITFW
jgi:hypothetical protein